MLYAFGFEYLPIPGLPDILSLDEIAAIEQTLDALEDAGVILLNLPVNQAFSWNDAWGPVPPTTPLQATFPFDITGINPTREDFYIATDGEPEEYLWPLTPTDPNHFDIPGPGDTPILLMSEGLDLQTPVYSADQLEAHWQTTAPGSTVFHARFPFLPHVVLPTSTLIRPGAETEPAGACARDTFLSFLDAPRTFSLPPCLAEAQQVDWDDPQVNILETVLFAPAPDPFDESDTSFANDTGTETPTQTSIGHIRVRRLQSRLLNLPRVP